VSLSFLSAAPTLKASAPERQGHPNLGATNLKGDKQ
jgi:hypothetical protein